MTLHLDEESSSNVPQDTNCNVWGRDVLFRELICNKVSTYPSQLPEYLRAHMMGFRNVQTPWKCLAPKLFLRAGLFSVTPFSEPPIDGRALVSSNDPLRRCPMLPLPYPASSRPKQSGISAPRKSQAKCFPYSSISLR